MTKSNKVSRNSGNQLQWISENEYPEEIKEAKAELTLNPHVRWAKFILTDDRPNGNNERVPLSEFDNLISTGVHMPIKMAEGKIAPGHDNATPIGVITNLKKEFVDGVNRIVGLAAMWLSERTSDIEYLKSRIDGGDPVDLSWELGASDKVLAPDGVWDWVGLHMKATTVVGNPAYQGRTRIIAMAAKNDDDNLPDSAFLYVESGGEKDSEGRTTPRSLRHFPVKDDKGLYVQSKLEEVLAEAKASQLPESVLGSVVSTATALLAKIEDGTSLEEIGQAEIAAPQENIVTEELTVELEARVKELEDKLAAAETSLKEKDDIIASLNTEKTAMASELEGLRTFKSEFDAEVAKAEKMESIKTKFAEAKLNKPSEYFSDNAEKLLKLDEASLDFMVQEFVAFSKLDAQASLEDENKLPHFTLEGGDIDVHEIAKALRERKSK